MLLSRRSIVLCLSLGLLVSGWLSWRAFSSHQPQEPPVLITKQPATFANRTFDPATPPPEMPPLGPGEVAECESDFASNASVVGESFREDATHATVTITRMNVTLQLNIAVWLPLGATQHVIEHEDGHRQISEYYYQGADKIAERIVARYIGRKVEITGTDLSAESTKALQRIATEFTDEYNRELGPGPAQLLYDAITDHSRNEVAAKDAVVTAVKNAEITSPQPITNLGT